MINRAQGATGDSTEELHRARLQVVHCAGYFDCASGFQLGEDRAVLPDVCNSDLNVLACNRVDESVVLRRTLALSVVYTAGLIFASNPVRLPSSAVFNITRSDASPHDGVI